MGRARANALLRRGLAGAGLDLAAWHYDLQERALDLRAHVDALGHAPPAHRPAHGLLLEGAAPAEHPPDLHERVHPLLWPGGQGLRGCPGLAPRGHEPRGRGRPRRHHLYTRIPPAQHERPRRRLPPGTGARPMKGIGKALLTTLSVAMRKPVTIEYPDEKHVLPARARSFPVLTWDFDHDEPFCTGCNVCIRNCPVDCMTATMIDNPKYAD